MSFIAHRLYTGKYNQLLLIVKFTRDGDDQALKPEKLAVAYTIMCNAKTFTGF